MDEELTIDEIALIILALMMRREKIVKLENYARNADFIASSNAAGIEKRVLDRLLEKCLKGLADLDDQHDLVDRWGGMFGVQRRARVDFRWDEARPAGGVDLANIVLDEQQQREREDRDEGPEGAEQF